MRLRTALHTRYRRVPLAVAGSLLGVTALGVALLAASPGWGTGTLLEHHRAVEAGLHSGAITGSVVGFGGTGSDLWATTTRGSLYLSTTGGAAWTASTPPASLIGVDVTNVAVAQYGTTIVWLVAPDNGREMLFRSADDGMTWSQPAPIASVPLSQETEAQLSTEETAPDVVTAQLVNSQVGFIVFDQYIAGTESIPTLDVSADSGESFTVMHLPTFGSVQFSSPTDGFLVGGPGNQRVYRTVDGGASWTQLSVTSPVDLDYAVGFPLSQSASTVVIPLYVRTSVGKTAETQLYAMDIPSSSAKVPAHALGSPLSVIGGVRTPKFVSTATSPPGTLVVFASGGKYKYTTGNRGTSWTESSASSGLPSGWSLGTVVSTGPTSDVAEASATSCAGTNEYGKEVSCQEQSALFVTNNSGYDWTRVNF